ncbi:MAG: hypothetical protein K2L13_03445 [Opitutales bacterium]|nr:hypothetical protein [Opitutales bacterium]
MNTDKIHSRNILLTLWLAVVVSTLSVFCLSVALVRSKQHIMQYGYKISQLESSCAAYGVKINELDKEILKLNLSITTDIRQDWVKNTTVYHVKKRDIQYFALSKKSGKGRAVAHNLRK